MSSLLQPYPPEDLDAFWQAMWAEACMRPLVFRRSPALARTATHDVDLISLTGSAGQTVEGWFARPPGGAPLPAFLWIPPYGRESLLPNDFGTREGFASMSFNLHGLGAFHREVYRPERGYFAEGAESPRSWVFRRMALDAMIALRVLAAQQEVDADRLAACGMSQGGGMAIWLGAYSSLVRAVCADMPFLSAMPYALSANVYRYPLKELVDFMDSAPGMRERVMDTLSYFDTLNLATRCETPTQVALGLKDPACKPSAVRAVYEALPGPKQLLEYPGGHDWDRGMIEANRAFMLQRLSTVEEPAAADQA